MGEKKRIKIVSQYFRFMAENRTRSETYLKIITVVSKITVLVLFTWYWWFFVSGFLRKISTQFDIQQFILGMPLLLVQYGPTFFIVFTWNQKSLVSRYFRNWYEFQVSTYLHPSDIRPFLKYLIVRLFGFFHTVKKHYTNRVARSTPFNMDKLTKHINRTFLFLELATAASCAIIFTIFYQSNFKISFLSLIYQMFTAIPINYFWYCNFIFTQNVAEKLIDDMQV